MKKIIWPDEISKVGGGLELSRIDEFFKYLRNIEDKMPPIFHVAGTNGKGSTTAFLKYILEEDGHLVHRFTSPHLVDVNERIEVSSKMISDEYLTKLCMECKRYSDERDLKISYFEGMTILGFLAFMKNPASATILEVGLGGRLDATNIIKKSLVSIITSISYDHMATLGETLPLIAMEKAGIIKENGTLIINKQQDEIGELLYNVGLEKNNKVHLCGKEWSVEKLKDSFIFRGFGKELEIPLPSLEGEYQIYNAGGAIAALLSQDKIKVSDEAIKNGVKKAKWAGRLQNVTEELKNKNMINSNVEGIIDGAHNEDAARQISKWVESKDDNKYNVLIIGILGRKDIEAYIKNLSKKFKMVITIKIPSKENSKNPEELKNEFIQQGFDNVIARNHFCEAYQYIKENVKCDTRILLAGSLYLLGDVLEYLRS